MTELHNKLLEISHDLGTAISDKEINPALAKLLNKKISQAINFIPCCKSDSEQLVYCFDNKKTVIYKEKKYFITSFTSTVNDDVYCDLVNIETYEHVDDININEIKIY